MPIVKNWMNPNILTVDQNQTVMDAVESLVRLNIGALGVTDGSDELIGIFSERDLLKRVVVQELDPKKTTIESVMTLPVITIHEDAPLNEAIMTMSDHHIRHLPVVNSAGAFVGMLGLREVATGLIETHLGGEVFNPSEHRR